MEPLALIPFGGYCSGPDGTVTMRGVRPGVYNAFVNIHDGVHGIQWVGLSRGTGAQARARLILAGDGATIALPDIKLDQAGTVTGTIRDEATGAPLENAFVAVASFHSGAGHGVIGGITDGAGRYTFGDLGPYAWTFFIRHFGHASVFTGGTGDRFFATGVTGTQPYQLHVASPLLVKLRLDAGPGNNWVGGNDFFSARVFLVGTGSPQVQDITLN